MKKIKFYVYFILGVIFMLLSRIKFFLFGYCSPRNFSPQDISKSIDYDMKVISAWLEKLDLYTGGRFNISNKSILEIGPGPDLGTGIILVNNGAKKYTAIDKNKLTSLTLKNFYTELIKKLEEKNKSKEDLLLEIDKFQRNKSERINYFQIPNDDFSCLKNNKVDVIFSQAVFEHFVDAKKTITGLSDAVSSGTVLIAEIDLMTHTSFLRRIDPLNIYRFCNRIYNLFIFPGSPNRMRPYEYRKIFEDNGWTNVQINPIIAVDEEKVLSESKFLSKKFRNPINQIHYLSIVLMATKK